MLVAKDTINCEKESMVFGSSGKDIYSGNAGADIEVFKFALEWNVPEVTGPVLQFVGEAVNGVAKLLREFAEINGCWEDIWPKYRIAHFGQTYASGLMSLNPGRVEANWKETGKAPSVSLITWGRPDDPS